MHGSQRGGAATTGHLSHGPIHGLCLKLQKIGIRESGRGAGGQFVILLSRAVVRACGLSGPVPSPRPRGKRDNDFQMGRVALWQWGRP